VVAEKAEVRPRPQEEAALREAEEQPRPRVVVEVPHHLVVAHQLAPVQRQQPVAVAHPLPLPRPAVAGPQLPGAMLRQPAKVLPRPPAGDGVVPQQPVEALLPLLVPRDQAPEEPVAGATRTETLMTGGSISK
jgi:hypothetical protein